METCIICTAKHIAAAEIFVHEANAGYPTHIIKALGQMDHAEIECRIQWPELSKIVHQQKKFISDALDKGDLRIADGACFDGLETLIMAIEGKWDMLNPDANNAKQYDAEKWILLGMDIRAAHGLPNPAYYNNATEEQALHLPAVKRVRIKTSDMSDGRNGHEVPIKVEDYTEETQA
jgi:hypothetical protein